MSPIRNNLIEQANREVAADVFEIAMTDLKREGIGEEEAFLSPNEFSNILEEVDHKVAHGKESTEEISNWVKARLRVLINRPNITEEQAAVFDELDATDNVDYHSIFEDSSAANDDLEYALAA